MALSLRGRHTAGRDVGIVHYRMVGSLDAAVRCQTLGMVDPIVRMVPSKSTLQASLAFRNCERVGIVYVSRARRVLCAP